MDILTYISPYDVNALFDRLSAKALGAGSDVVTATSTVRARRYLAYAGSSKAEELPDDLSHPVTLSADKLTSAERSRYEATDYPEVDRPRRRSECAGGPRPCPFVSCHHHLYLDVNPVTGALKLNFPSVEVAEMSDTCSLDVADLGGLSLEEVGERINLTRERARQIEMQGLLKIREQVDGLWADREASDSRPEER